ncbi:hypothetical protein J1N35_037044 [Gossypium stocksii]|uniref:Uncharacterized protein n=1 Tax=Gossypium stocksii TaxID=47602 RepID=A0A9D3UJU6_9ROSI|nr:hypothetical protein J1N35_037044 [Gossypium stocksii]
MVFAEGDIVEHFKSSMTTVGKFDRAEETRICDDYEELCSYLFNPSADFGNHESRWKTNGPGEGAPSNHQLGRKAGVGVKDDIGLTANVGAGEDDSDVALLASLNAVTTAPQRHHFYSNERH